MGVMTKKKERVISDRPTVSRKLIEKREEMHLTPWKMCVYIINNGMEISPSLYTAWESGTRIPNVEHIKKLSSVLNVPIQYFFD